MPLFDDLADPAVVAHLSAEAEEAGWHGVFVWDNLRYEEPVVDVADPWITLAAMATATERIRLGPMVTPLARRRPAKVARETATLDRLSGGRGEVLLVVLLGALALESVHGGLEGGGALVVGDLGCGTGQLTETVAPYVRQVVAVDSSNDMLDEGQLFVRGVSGDREVRAGRTASTLFCAEGWIGQDHVGFDRRLGNQGVPDGDRRPVLGRQGRPDPRPRRAVSDRPQ